VVQALSHDEKRLPQRYTHPEEVAVIPLLIQMNLMFAILYLSGSEEISL
jgi:hypothetical protein